MKIKILAPVIVMGVLCSFSEYRSTPTGYIGINQVQPSEGELIMKKLDCATCHKIDKKVIGPSFLDISKKYPMNDKNTNYLADKIIKGGSGIWGAIPMAAHPTLKKEDAKKIAKYILSLSK